MADHRTTSSARVARNLCIPILVLALLSGGLPSAAGAATQTETKDLLKCAKKLIKNAAAFMKSERKQVGKCSQLLLACDLKLANGEIDSEKFGECEGKAKEKCTRAKDKELEQEEIRSEKILLACQAPTVVYDDVIALPEGLGYGIGPCGSEPNLPSFIGCLKGAETLKLALSDVTLALPRSRELLEAANVAGDFPDLPPPLCGNGVPNDGEECDDGNFDNGDGCSKDCKDEPVAFFRTLDRLLAYLRLDPIRVAHAQVPSKPLLKCGKRIESGVRKFLDFEIKKVSACALTYLKCDLKFLNADIDADKFLRCKSKADDKCDDIKTKESKKKAKTSSRILDRCSLVAFSDIMDVSGLGYGVGSCSQEPNLPALVDCMVAATEAEDQALLAVSLLMPRARELLEARAQETGQPAPFALPDPRCGNGALDPGESCDDGNTVSGDGCDRDCTLSSGGGLLGSHKCALDPNASSLSFFPSLGSLTVPLSGAIDINCGEIDPNTGRAPCECEIQELAPFELIGIGFICLTSGLEPCPTGEIDCNGGNALDWDLVSDHNVGPCTGNPDCDAQCDAYCGALGKAKADDGACEGFCNGGGRDGLPCAQDTPDPNGPGCPDGACNGGDGLPHLSICGCQCISLGGAPSRAGGLACQIPTEINLELAAPCGDGDVLIAVGTSCVNVSTETSTSTILNNNNDPNGFSRSQGSFGAPTDCSALITSVTSGTSLAGVVNFFDSVLGDLITITEFTCQ